MQILSQLCAGEEIRPPKISKINFYLRTDNWIYDYKIELNTPTEYLNWIFLYKNKWLLQVKCSTTLTAICKSKLAT